MRLLEVLIERKVQSLNRSFTYAYLGDKNVEKGFRVLIPFNNKNIIGYVLNVLENKFCHYEKAVFKTQKKVLLF